jgi:hypothetical protein
MVDPTNPAAPVTIARITTAGTVEQSIGGGQH